MLDLARVRLPFHLCQPGGKASCGACCGLYNFRDHSRQALTAALTRRTERVSGAERTLDAYRQAATELRSGDPDPLFGQVRVCPLLGFLDAERTRVGCLAHPAVTGGTDLRDCGVYTAEICETFECPSFIWLNAPLATLIRNACDDWYLYGLVITDVELVRGMLSLLERELAGPVNVEHLGSPALLPLVRAFFALKEHAPGRDEGGAVFGRFDPDGTGDGSLRIIDYGAFQTRPAPEDDVVLCLGYRPESVEDLERARSVVRSHAQAIADAYARA